MTTGELILAIMTSLESFVLAVLAALGYNGKRKNKKLKKDITEIIYEIAEQEKNKK